MVFPPNKDTPANVIERHLPFLRRYGRALTGSQELGDTYCASTLEILIKQRTLRSAIGAKVTLFKTFHDLWHSDGAPIRADETGLGKAAQEHLKTLRSEARAALLLFSLEELSEPDIAAILSVDVNTVGDLIAEGREEVRQSATGSIIIIEDEAMIALDLQSIVTTLGHRVIGVASTRDAAAKLAKIEAPDLALVDIQLADNSSGIHAVNDILEQKPDLPVVFITAFPERLLTGSRPEPTFLITKPYSEDQISTAVAQAMFFASVEPLLD